MEGLLCEGRESGQGEDRRSGVWAVAAPAVAAGSAIEVIRGGEDEQAGQRVEVAVLAGVRRGIMGCRHSGVLRHSG